MNRSTVVGVIAVIFFFIGLVAWQRHEERSAAPPKTVPTPVPKRPPSPTVEQTEPRTQPARIKGSEAKTTASLSVEEKRARIEKIKKDYDEIRTRTSAEYSAAGAAFPGGLNAFLRQLALLEREKKEDLAAILTPQELEDMELQETPAGQLVTKLLGDAPITDGQRRTVFRLQKDYEDRYGLTYNVTAQGLYEREAARQGLQEQIRAVVGDDVFAKWLQGEGNDYAQFTAFAAREKLPASAPLDLWRAKSDFTLQRLELLARPGPPRSPEQLRAAQAALTHQMEARVLQIVGPGLMQRARTEVLGWLPKQW